MTEHVSRDRRVFSVSRLERSKDGNVSFLAVMVVKK